MHSVFSVKSALLKTERSLFNWENWFIWIINLWFVSYIRGGDYAHPWNHRNQQQHSAVVFCMTSSASCIAVETFLQFRFISFPRSSLKVPLHFNQFQVLSLTGMYNILIIFCSSRSVVDSRLFWGSLSSLDQTPAVRQMFVVKSRPYKLFQIDEQQQLFLTDVFFELSFHIVSKPHFIYWKINNCFIILFEYLRIVEVYIKYVFVQLCFFDGVSQ